MSDPTIQSPLRMADTIRPDLLPAGFTDPVAAYRTGRYAWPDNQIRRFSRMVGISTTGRAASATLARFADVERYDATPAQAPAFLDARAEAGHHDGGIYCSRFTLPYLFEQLGPRRPRLWIATLDNIYWTPVALCANIADNWHLEIDPAWIWAIQCFPADPAIGISWDTSLVYGEHDFWDPR